MRLFNSDVHAFQKNVEPALTYVTTVGMAIGLQILVTLPFGSTGIRIALADTAVIPVAMMLAILAVKRGTDMLPIVSRLPLIALLGAMTAIFGVALIIGRLNIGEWLPWPLLNKWGGWWVLVVYFLVGVWTRSLFDENSIERGLRTLLVFSYLSVAFGLVLYELFLIGFGNLSYPRLSGFFANPNAYGCALAVFIMMQLGHLWADRLFPWWLHIVGIGILVTGVILSGSRSAWIGSAAGFLCLLVLRKIRLRDTVAVIVATSVLLSAIYGTAILVTATSNQSKARASGESGAATSYLVETIKQLNTRTYITRDYSDSGISHRIRISERAVEYWKESPVLGIGLGAFLHRVTAEKEISPATIHTTALWLLTEMGVLGLLCFTAFLAFVTATLIRKARSSDSDGGALEYGVAAAVVVVAAASVGTELLYQRHIWWLVGFALAYRTPPSEAMSDSLR